MNSYYVLRDLLVSSFSLMKNFVLKVHGHDFKELPGGSDGKESACNAGDLGLIHGLGRSLVKEMETHSSILAWRIPMDRGAWWATVHEVEKKQTRLSDKHFSLS